MKKFKYDNTCKYLAEQYPREFAQWLLGVEAQDIQDISVLKTELSVEPIQADSITFLQANNQILHIEFQTLPNSNPPIPLRMLDYAIRLKRKYLCPVVQIVIFLKETTSDAVFAEEYQDETTTHRYRVIRLWEQDSTIFLNNLALLPLAPLARTNSPEGLLAQLSEKIATISSGELRQNLSSCTQILAGLRFDKDLIRQYLRKETMKESVIYQDIWEEATREATQKEAYSLVIRQLNRRLGEIDSSLKEKIQLLSVEKLETLGEALLDFSEITDLITWLEQQDNN